MKAGRPTWQPLSNRTYGLDSRLRNISWDIGGGLKNIQSFGFVVTPEMDIKATLGKAGENLGGTFLFSEGDWFIDDQLVVSMPVGSVRLIGKGVTTRFVFRNVSAGLRLLVDDLIVSGIHFVDVDDASMTGRIQVVVGGATTGCVVDSCYFSASQPGVAALAVAGVGSGHRISDNIVYTTEANNYSFLDMMATTTGPGNVWIGNIFHQTATDANIYATDSASRSTFTANVAPTGSTFCVSYKTGLANENAANVGGTQVRP